jgi:signal transduction histidine kinase
MRLYLHPARLPTCLTRRALRLRLAALYGVLFLVSGVGLVAITVAVTGWQFPPDSPGFRQPVGQSHPYQVQLIIVLGVMAAASVALGWLVAGRILRPLRAITAATRQICEDDLHRRLAMPGARNELKDLADTIDGLLARLQNAFDAQRNFIANAAHELRTPLTLERAMLEVALADPDATAETLRSTCEDVLEAGRHQEQLIEALLTLARSQRGLDHRDLVDLAVITGDVLRARDSDAAHCGLDIRAAVTTAPILGDARLLERLVANLIDNAIRHNIPQGRIDLHVTASGSRSRLTISNTGPVIPVSQATQLLQPFQRRPASRPADTEGLGLGLSIVAAIAKAHHGSLTITPRSHGGLDIDISFPATTAIPAARNRALATT